MVSKVVMTRYHRLIKPVLDPKVVPLTVIKNAKSSLDFKLLCVNKIVFFLL